MSLTRRSFMVRLAALAAAGAAGGASAPPPPREPRRPIIDFHAHLFGVGDSGSGCFLSPAQKRHVNYRFFLMLLGLSENGRMDEDYIDRIVAQLRGSSVQRALLLAQDCRYDAAGRPDHARTSFFVPNEYLFEVCRRFPDLFIPCASINPRRRDALDELEKCAAGGARVMKIHPPIQAVDPGDPAFRPFYRRCAERKLIVMAHTGTEHAAEISGHENCDPARLALALDEGCTAVAAHSGMGDAFDREDFFPSLESMVERYPNLYCETGNLGSMFRWRNLPRLLGSPRVLERLIHASDFPFPPNPLVFWNRIAPWRLLSLLAERNIFERDLRLKMALGLPAEVFERGARLLGVAGG